MSPEAEAAMNPSSPAPESAEADRHALVDGRLSPAAAARVRSGLDAAAQREAKAWAHQRALLRDLHAEGAAPALPQALLQAADRLEQAQLRQGHLLAWSAVLGSWVLAFGLGWGVHGQWAGGTTLASASPSPATLFAHQAAVAHAVYEPEQRHPVEVGAAQQDHLVQWLSRRLAHPLMAPDLRAQGFGLVGGRLLPGGNGARAQFMYQNAAGTRVTLYLGALDPAQAATAAVPAAAFEFRSEGAISSFYWTEQGLGYALSATLPRTLLHELATAVYQQILAAAPTSPQPPGHKS